MTIRCLASARVPSGRTLSGSRCFACCRDQSGSAPFQRLRVADDVDVKRRPAAFPPRAFTAESTRPSIFACFTAIPLYISTASAHRARRSSRRPRTLPLHPPDVRLYEDISAEGWLCLFIFTEEAYGDDADFAARMLTFHNAMLHEDPATGSVNTAFAAHLRSLAWCPRCPGRPATCAARPRCAPPRRRGTPGNRSAWSATRCRSGCGSPGCPTRSISRRR